MYLCPILANGRIRSTPFFELVLRTGSAVKLFSKSTLGADVNFFFLSKSTLGADNELFLLEINPWGRRKLFLSKSTLGADNELFFLEINPWGRRELFLVS